MFKSQFLLLNPFFSLHGLVLLLERIWVSHCSLAEHLSQHKEHIVKLGKTHFPGKIFSEFNLVLDSKSLLVFKAFPLSLIINIDCRDVEVDVLHDKLILENQPDLAFFSHLV
jgi:hypothetical protein